MYTGGQLLGTFPGPAKLGQIAEVEGSERTGRYVLIQQNSSCLRLHEVEAFGRVGSVDAECEEALQLEVVNGSFSSMDEGVDNLLTQDEREWRADESTTEDQGFMLMISEGNKTVTGIRMQNAAQPWATEKFKVTGAFEKTGPWINLVEEELEDTTAIKTFNFGRPWLLRFLKFELLRYGKQRGGGLRFFSILTGTFLRLFF